MLKHHDQFMTETAVKKYQIVTKDCGLLCVGIHPDPCYFRVPRKRYHGILLSWMRLLSVGKSLLLVGEADTRLPRHFKYIEQFGVSFRTVQCCDLTGGDFKWDIVRSAVPTNDRFSCVVCQATLEHVADPVAAIRNMKSALLPGGVLLVHTHVECVEHRHPIDCFRFLPDAVDAVAELVDADVLDWVVHQAHIFWAYRWPSMGLSNHRPGHNQTAEG